LHFDLDFSNSPDLHLMIWACSNHDLTFISPDLTLPILAYSTHYHLFFPIQVANSDLGSSSKREQAKGAIWLEECLHPKAH
jgi:hypothetical protein